MMTEHKADSCAILTNVIVHIELSIAIVVSRPLATKSNQVQRERCCSLATSRALRSTYAHVSFIALHQFQINVPACYYGAL